MADEVYYFKKAIKPQKETSAVNLPVSAQAATPMMDIDNEDSMDAPSVGSTDTPIVSTPARKVRHLSEFINQITDLKSIATLTSGKRCILANFKSFAIAGKFDFVYIRF